MARTIALIAVLSAAPLLGLAAINPSDGWTAPNCEFPFVTAAKMAMPDAAKAGVSK